MGPRSVRYLKQCIFQSIFKKPKMNATSTGFTSAAGSGIISSDLPGIDSLTGGDNWDTWKFAVQTFPELEDIWCEVRPTKNDDGRYVALHVVLLSTLLYS